MTVRLIPSESTVIVREFPSREEALAYAVAQWRAYGCQPFTVFIEE